MKFPDAHSLPLLGIPLFSGLFSRLHSYFWGVFLLVLISWLPATAYSQEKDLPTFTTTNSMQLETRRALNAIQELHILNTDFRTLDYDKLVENYLARLDFARMYLLQEDYDNSLLRFSKSMQSYLNNGLLYPAFQMFITYRQRVIERVQWVEERLKGDFDLESDLVFETNRKDASWPASMEEANELWEKRLLLELIRNTLDGKDMDAAKKQVLQQFERAKRNLISLEAEDIQEIFLTTMMQLFDPHSSFMSANMTEDMAINMQNALEGIGAVLRDEDGTCIIHELIPPGPAYRSGQLKPRDRILGVGQQDQEIEDVQGLPLRKVVNRIRGKSGSIVTLLVQPGNSDDPADRKTIHLTREKIQLTASLAKATIYDIPQADKTLKIGVIELPSFYGSKETGISATKDVEELVRKLTLHNIDGLVLDMRNNGGGLLYEAISMTGLFIRTGPVVAVRDYRKKISVSHDYNPKIVYEGPLMVLVSRHSASAAEILAGALQSYNRALVVGDSSTHGKGTVQSLLPLWEETEAGRVKSTSIKLTNSQFFLPNGSSTQLEGVKSDIVIPSINEVLDVGESALTNAIAWDELNPAIWNYTNFKWDSVFNINPSLVQYLTQQSTQRMEALDEFKLTKEYIHAVDAQRQQTQLMLNLDTRREEKEKWDLFRKEWRKQASELAHNLAYASQTYDLAVVEDIERTTSELEQGEQTTKAEPVIDIEETETVESESAEDLVSNDHEEEIDVDNFDLDVSLRESLRILSDWVTYIGQKSNSEQMEASLQRTGTE